MKGAFMQGSEFDMDAYLQRIQHTPNLSPTVDTLKELHHTHLYTLPFENFDILLGRGINLAPSAIFEKLVHQRRGGYCFELNGLFTSALNMIDFDVRVLLVRVHIAGTPTGRGHQIELVTVEGQAYLDALKAHFGIELHVCPTSSQ
jgi:N-hydroxyarylamine O-acetyltransferase